jgi:hypothetical protein
MFQTSQELLRFNFKYAVTSVAFAIVSVCSLLAMYKLLMTPRTLSDAILPSKKLTRAIPLSVKLTVVRRIALHIYVRLDGKVGKRHLMTESAYGISM